MSWAPGRCDWAEGRSALRRAWRPDMLLEHPSEDKSGEFIEERIVSMPILLLNVHVHCNCRCMMCDIWQRTDGKELDLLDFARHRDSIVRLGVRQVVLTGGEPLLHRNLEVLLRFLRECNVRI